MAYTTVAQYTVTCIHQQRAVGGACLVAFRYQYALRVLVPSNFSSVELLLSPLKTETRIALVMNKLGRQPLETRLL